YKVIKKFLILSPINNRVDAINNIKTTKMFVGNEEDIKSDVASYSLNTNVSGKLKSNSFTLQ
ncbi:MAG TPA: hypothetical protein VFU62_13660, partial [Hanamia sp.]|nr:hypothetical protein [Hanamia sp.]